MTTHFHDSLQISYSTSKNYLLDFYLHLIFYYVYVRACVCMCARGWVIHTFT